MSSIPDIRYIATLMDQGKSVEAGEQLERFVQELPWHAGGRILMARWCESQSRPEEALGHWKEARALNPESRVIEEGIRSLVVGRVYGQQPGLGRQDVPAFQDLEQLIEELESARIVPNPDIQLASEDDLEDDIDDVVSETLARIYANQNYLEEAARVYEKLADQQPVRASEFRRKAREMRQKGE